MLELHTVTLGGIHFKKQGKGGMYRAPLPFEPEEGAHSGQWDAETSTLHYKEPVIEEGEHTDDVLHEVTITPAEIEAAIEYVNTPAPPKVPESVETWGILAQCDILGWTSSIEAVVESLPEPTKTIVSRGLSQSNNISIRSPFVQQVLVGLGKTQSEIDQLFISAEAIVKI